MKRNLLKTIARAFLCLVAFCVAFVVWLLWPDSGSLVGAATHSDIPAIKRSLLLGADINGYSMWGWHRENKGNTPLDAAVTYGSLDTVKLLLDRGADPNQRDGVGTPPICTAAMLGRLDVSKALIEAGAKVGLPEIDYYGKPKKTAIEYAQDAGYIDLEKFLRENSEPSVPPNRSAVPSLNSTPSGRGSED
jgi:hypothetical protein